MNHRQWKKNFKKINGRNPIKYQEDKKYKNRLMGKLCVDSLITFINTFKKINWIEIIGRIYDCLNELSKEANEAIKILSEGLNEISDKLNVKEEN